MMRGKEDSQEKAFVALEEKRRRALQAFKFSRSQIFFTPGNEVKLIYFGPGGNAEELDWEIPSRHFGRTKVEIRPRLWKWVAVVSWGCTLIQWWMDRRSKRTERSFLLSNFTGK